MKKLVSKDSNSQLLHCLPAWSNTTLTAAEVPWCEWHDVVLHRSFHACLPVGPSVGRTPARSHEQRHATFSWQTSDAKSEVCSGSKVTPTTHDELKIVPVLESPPRGFPRVLRSKGGSPWILSSPKCQLLWENRNRGKFADSKTPMFSALLKVKSLQWNSVCVW